MLHHKTTMRTEIPRIYSQDLLDAIFGHPYSKIGFIQQELQVSRLTAVRYLDELCRIGVMQKVRRGRENYFLNGSLIELLANRVAAN